MDSAPLIKAHDHAKAAADATHSVNSNPTVAIDEHARAAGEFANAARSTTSVEALRTLKLLEEHHRRLAELLKLSVERPPQDRKDREPHRVEEKDGAAATTSPAQLTTHSSTDDEPSSEKSHKPPRSLPKPHRYPSRDLGSSIANNLASARGIRNKMRSQPLSPSLSSTEAPGNLELGTRRSNSGSKSKMQNMLEQSDRPGSATSLARPVHGDDDGEQDGARLSYDTASGAAGSSDDGFSKFYSAFGSIINRISAPLAFAGLPLVQEDSAEDQLGLAEPAAPVLKKSVRLKASPSMSAEPDLSKIYSRATLRAFPRDGQSATDSFYVVPTSGHTVSYASILSYADKEKRRMEASGHGNELSNVMEDPDEDDFVDAKETQTQAPTSPGLRRKASRPRSDKDMSNVVEELYLENKSLKDMLDKLSRRLHAFESMSQTSGMRLAESMRLMRPGSPGASGPSKAVVGGDDALVKRNRELEEQLVIYSRQLDELQKDYGKAKANLVRYRQKWDELKAGAKARRASGIQLSSEGPDDPGAGSRSPSLA